MCQERFKVNNNTNDIKKRRERKDNFKKDVEITHIKQAPLPGSSNMYDHLVTLRWRSGIQERFFVCFAEAGKVKDVLYSTEHLKKVAEIKMKEHLVNTGKIKPSLYIEEVVMFPSEGQEFHTWLKKVDDDDLWTALMETVVNNSKQAHLEAYQVTADTK